MANPFNPFAADAPAAAADDSDAAAVNPFGDANPFSAPTSPAVAKAADDLAACNPFGLPKVELGPGGVAAKDAHKSIKVHGTGHDSDGDGTDNECGDDAADAAAAAERVDKVPDLPSAPASRKSSANFSPPLSPQSSTPELDGRSMPTARLRRTPSLSNKSQLEVMQMVRDGRLSTEQALDWAERREKQEAVPKLSNSMQIKILSLVKSGEMTHDQALAYAQEKEEEEMREKRKHEGQQHIKEFYDILSQVSELREEDGLAPPRSRMDTGSSLERDMAAAKEILEGKTPVETA